MATQSKELYVTQTGMPINTSHAFFNVPGVDKIFNTIKVSTYQTVQDALNEGLIESDTKLVIFAVGESLVSIPLKHIAFHHVAEGQVNGVNWTVTFCGCCNMGNAFNPVIDGTVHHFSGTGVYHGMAIFRDKETGSYWEHATGECVHGELQGRQLDPIPVQYMLAEQLFESNPDALVTTAKQTWWQRFLDRLLMKDLLTPKGYMPPPFRLSFGEVDKRLPEMQLGLGVWNKGKARFYSMQTIKAHDGAIIDTINGSNFVVFIDPIAQAPMAYQTDAASASWDGNTLVLDTGEGICNGYVQKGDSAEERIDASHQQYVRWYAFAYKFPNCEIYE